MYREPWEFSVRGAAKPAAAVAATAGGVVLLTQISDPNAAAVGFLAAGAVGVLYAGIDLMGRVSALVDDHQRRQAETAAVSPAERAYVAEERSIRARLELVQAIASLDGQQLDYARQLLDTASIEADGNANRLVWRLAGNVFPVYAAWVWLTQYDPGSDYLPTDAGWDPMTHGGLARDEWRRVASAVVEGLAAQGVAMHAASRHGPRWTVAAQQPRQAALAALQVYNAAEIWRAMHEEADRAA